MSLYQAYETDAQLEKDGVHIPVGIASNGKTATIRVRRAGGANQMFAKVFEQKSKPHRRVMEIPGALSPEVQEKILREVYVDAVVTGWDNVEGRDGQPLEFTRENALRLFEDLPDLFKVVVRDSQDAAIFRKAVREAESGN